MHKSFTICFFFLVGATAMGNAKTATIEISAPLNISKVISFFTEGRQVDFKIAVADSTPSRKKGLMYRKSMPADQGMLFVFDKEKDQKFWMKNTYISLDIIFLQPRGDDFEIVGIVENAEPLSTKYLTVGKPTRHVLELNGGTTKLNGLKVGMRARVAPIK